MIMALKLALVLFPWRRWRKNRNLARIVIVSRSSQPRRSEASFRGKEFGRFQASCKNTFCALMYIPSEKVALERPYN
jgi:hypothetical protein